MKHICFAWAKNKSAHLRQFDFVFHIALKLTKKDQTLEDMIVQQHSALKRHNVPSSRVKEILDGKEKQKILILLDGFDEYQEGTTVHVEEALNKKSLPHSCLVLTSRDTKEVVAIRQYMDIEAEITGFDPEKVEEYIKKYLGSEEKCQELIELSKSKQLRKDFDQNIDYGIMHIPILLHMICVLFQTRVSLPKTRIGIISAIADRCPDWEAIRVSGRKADTALKLALATALVQLGKLVCERLDSGNKDLVFTKV